MEDGETVDMARGVSDRTGGVSVGRCGTHTHISKCRMMETCR